MPRKPRLPTAPTHLEPTTRRWWRAVVEQYVLGEHHLRLLRLACEAWDRGQQARVVLAECGLTYTDHHGQPRARPEVAIERDSRIGFARLLRELCLDVEPPVEARPPRRTGTGG
jgi:P27 family predicted phage terminase small subunit